MIIKFKLFESINRRLKIGDFITTDKNHTNSYVKVKPYEIGKLYNISGGDHYWFSYDGGKICIDIEDILLWSENKEELELMINTQKYNI